MFVLDEIVLIWKCRMLHDLYTFEVYRSLIATQFFFLYLFQESCSVAHCC